MIIENEHSTNPSGARFMLSPEQMARERSYAREDQMRHERTMKKMISDRDDALAEKDNALAEMDIALSEMAQEIAELKAQLAEKK